VDFADVEDSTPAAADLLIRPSPGGVANIVLGSTDGAWGTSSQIHNGTPGVTVEGFQSERQPPGGVVSVVLSAPNPTTSVDALLARPACGGAATVVLGAHASTWSTSSSVSGAGCASAVEIVHTATGPADSIDLANQSEHVPTRASKKMVPAGEGASTLILGDEGVCPAPGVSANRFSCGSNQNQGNCITDRSTTRLHQAPGGNSSINLSDGSIDVKAASANRFANGSNQNQGNWMTERSTTRLHQAPGGNSSINLGDDRSCPLVGVSASRFAKTSLQGENSNVGIRVQQAPGGASSLMFGQGKASVQREQDENVNISNLQSNLQDGLKLHSAKFEHMTHQAPGGNSNMVLG